MSKILYLGLDLPPELQRKEVTHCPLIRIVPRPREHPEIIQAFEKFNAYTHLIFTSKSAVRIFFEYAIYHFITLDMLNHKMILSIGQKTTRQLKDHGINHVVTAKEETAEGMIALLASGLNLIGSFIFWPHSALSRPVLLDWLRAQELESHSCIFYDTVQNIPNPMLDISSYDEVIFTSPSTVDAFCAFFGKLPTNKILTCIGSVTQNYLSSRKVKPRNG